MRALIVRPQPTAIELCNALNNIGVVSEYCPVVSFQKSALSDNQLQHLYQSEIIIGVSQPAVHFTHEILSDKAKKWPQHSQYLAVGTKTASYLQSYSQQTVHSPRSEDSEGLLKLLFLKSLKNKKVSILRGDSGRELLFNQLQQFGADVAYIESYTRQWISFDGHRLSLQWQASEIDTLIVTSYEQLKFFAQQIPNQHKNWLHSLKLMVPSERVAQLALQLGFIQTCNIKGASNQTIMNSIQGELHRKI
ncbi:hypothetical protein A9264_04425 [Vibrio sp. UCD-FRSSP16_10]|uniref:uroporphyrinogen-III synthase n=1 Tax=unclassified Vibrio TaxID=2614977 RepID=UPI000801FFFD|nr:MULTISPECIES: uroporphyrinogen-III synthase [unclassified Vibrio]OBT10211.1 hypothetical protein A9260_05875 [Vibrio sp. UCD-FRSSP16_30]OBT19001.1 hypothetical protein A9264_04425 [Vibrio sp. UCD-FRSSP16_10]